VAVLAGCGDGKPAAVPSPVSLPSSAAGVDCAADAVAGKQVRFGARGASDLGGVLFGTGHVGIVFAHQAAGNVCDWAAYAKEMSRRRYRTLVFDFSGSFSSSGATNDLITDVAAAAAFLRGAGVDTVVLAGASMGGTSVITAATTIQPPVAGVIALSAVQTWLGVNATTAAPKLTVPALYLVGQHDRSVSDAQALQAATPAALGKLVIVDAASHGVGLLKPNSFDGEAAAKTVRAEIDGFLARVAPA